MEFMRHIETLLRDLATVARSASNQNHVIECAEHGIVKLRELRSRYAREVRESNQISSVAPTTTAPNHSNHNIFRCDELLEPFILTCNPSSPPSMVSIALNGLNYLLTSSAILPDSMLQVMTALTSVGLTPPQPPQSNNPLKQINQAINNNNAPQQDAPSMMQLKAMQTSILLLNSLTCEEMTQELTASILNLSGQLMLPPTNKSNGKRQSKGREEATLVSNAATATFSQLISLIFDMVASEVQEGDSFVSTPAPPPPPPCGIQSAVDVFTNLCELGESISTNNQSSRPPSPLTPSTTPKTVRDAFDSLKSPAFRTTSFSLITMTLKSQPSLFKKIPEFNSLLRYKVCPLVTTTLLSEHHRDFDDSTMSVNDFGLFLKLMSLSSTVLLVYGGPDLAGECHILLTTLLHFVNASTQTYSTTPTSHISPYHFTDDENRSYERHLKENGFDDKDFAASMHAQHAQHGDNGDENQQSAYHPPPLPVVTVWRTALSLEILYNVCMDKNLISSMNNSFDEHRPNNTIVLSLSQTVSDFVNSATTERHILEIVTASRRSAKEYSPSMTPKPSDTVPAPPSEGTVLHLAIQTMGHLVGQGGMKESVGIDEWVVHCAMYLSGCEGVIECVLGNYCVWIEERLKEADEAVKSRALSTLCKFAIPSDGRLDTFHVRVVESIFTVVHGGREGIGKSWVDIMACLEKLSLMTLANKQLSDEAYDTAIALSSSLSQFSEFTCTLSPRSLLEVLSALSSLKGSSRSDYMTSRPAPAVVAETGFGSRLLGLARNTIQKLSEQNQAVESRARLHPQRMFGEDMRERAFSRVEDGRVVDGISFGLIMVLDIARVNAWRGKFCNLAVCRHLSSISLSPNINSTVRTFAIEALASIIVSEASSEPPSSSPYKNKAARVVTGVEDLFRTRRYGSSESLPQVSDVVEEEPQVEEGSLFEPLMDIVTASDQSISAAGLQSLQSILEKIGQGINCWPMIIGTVKKCEGPGAFKCLKFIIDEFLDNIGNGLRELIAACESFAFSTSDVNTSLTSISLLWSISDRSADPIPILLSLLRVSLDSRPEVRNCAVNTLFSCIVGSDGSTWDTIFEEVVVQLLERVEEGLRNAAEEGAGGGEERGGKGFIMAVHHSRDSPRKQWAETYKVALQGLSRLLRQFLSSFPLPANLHSVLLNLCTHTLTLPAECACAGIELMLLIVEVVGGGESEKVGDKLEMVNGALQRTETSPKRSPGKPQPLSPAFQESFAALKEIPKATTEPDILSPLADGIRGLHESLSASIPQSQFTNGMVDLCVDIATCCENSTKYPTGAEKSSISTLKALATSSPHAFKALSTLASSAFQGSGTCVNLEAARSLGDVVGDGGGKSNNVIDALANLVTIEVKEGHGGDLSHEGTGFWRDEGMERLGEMLLPLLKSGLSKIKGTREERDKMASEYERLSESEERKTEREIAIEKRIWDGTIETLHRFLRPKRGNGSDDGKAKADRDPSAVVDTALAILTVVLSMAEGPEIWSRITNCLGKAGNDCIDAAKWLVIDKHSATGSPGRNRSAQADSELRVVRACIINLALAVEEGRAGAKEHLSSFAIQILESLVQSGKVLTRVCNFSEAAPPVSPKHKARGPFFGEERMARTSSDRKQSLEAIVQNGGGSFGLDDDADDDGEEESDDEEGLLGISGDKRLGRLTKTHAIQMNCAVILCEELVGRVDEYGNVGNSFADIFASISGILVQVITCVDDSRIKKAAGDIVGSVDFVDLVSKGKEVEELRKRVAELEAKVETLESQQGWSILT
ncbi:hypothetical protein TrST_g1190 [Triparma strigata]|uniref:Uncharacterized protein n=1 Tax=Triparma strigata TaxID=1606541 RepID=A0A9W7B1Y9_9STRA|nr:hypothetical protein TrST_g1190 [Triparma strigata]